MDIERRIKELQEEIKFNTDFPNYIRRLEEEIIKLKKKKIYEHKQFREDRIQRAGR